MKNTSLYIKRITVSAVFLSIALVLKTTMTFYIPLFGQSGISVGLSGVFSIMPSLLYGPVYGAVVAGLADLLGYLLKPTGAYLPLMTLIVALGGFLRGWFWGKLHNTNTKIVRAVVAIFSFGLLVFGICNVAFLYADGVNADFYSHHTAANINTDNMHLVSKLLITRTMNMKDPAASLPTYITFLTSGIIITALLALLLLLGDYFLSQKLFNGKGLGKTPQLLIALIVSGMIVTTLNTVVLRETLYASWKVLPFAVVWIPRAIEELLGNTVKAYFIAFLLNIFETQPSLSRLVGNATVGNEPQPKVKTAPTESLDEAIEHVEAEIVADEATEQP